MQQLPHYLQGPCHGHEIPLVGAQLILAARASPTHPDDGLGSVEMGFWWWDIRLGRCCFTAIAHGGPLPTPWPIQAPAGQFNRGRSGPPVPYRFQHPNPFSGPLTPDNANDHASNSDEALSYGSVPTDMDSDTLGQTPPDGNYSDSDLE